MTNLIGSISSTRSKIERYADFIIKEKQAQKFPERMKRWRGKLLVSEREWNQRIGRLKEVSKLRFMPADFIDHPFSRYDNFAEMDKQFTNWIKDYDAYLKFTKNEKYANYLIENDEI